MILVAVAVAVLLEVLMPQPWGQLVRRDHVLVWGMPGCGKTPFAASLAEDARRVVYFDPTGEWSDLGECVPGDYLLGGDPAELAAELLTGSFLRVVVEPDEAQLADHFEATVNVCRAAAPLGGLVLLVDEVGDLTGGCTDTLNALHRNGHKDGIATVFASPCVTDVPKRCRDTASRVYSFFQKNAADRRALADEYGDAFAAQAAGWRYPAPPAAWINPTLHA